MFIIIDVVFIIVFCINVVGCMKYGNYVVIFLIEIDINKVVEYVVEIEVFNMERREID